LIDLEGRVSFVELERPKLRDAVTTAFVDEHLAELGYKLNGHQSQRTNAMPEADYIVWIDDNRSFAIACKTDKLRGSEFFAFVE